MDPFNRGFAHWRALFANFTAARRVARCYLGSGNNAVPLWVLRCHRCVTYRRKCIQQQLDTNLPQLPAPDVLLGRGGQYPGVAFGNPVGNLPDDISNLYEEARAYCSGSSYTAAVLVLRKLLMNIAVQKGASENLKFIEYVKHLSANGYVPPDGKSWVDHIRQKGNEATHEIQLMDKKDAEDLILFSEMLLKFIYEFPSLISQPVASVETHP